MASYDQNIINIRNNLLKSRFTDEIEYLTENGCDTEADNNRLAYLRDILNIKSEKEEVPTKTNFKDYLDKISNNVYKNKWNSLTKFHKSVKLKEYAFSLTDKKKLAGEIYSVLLRGVDDKKIHTSKSVNYNQATEKIESIVGFEFKDGKYTVNF